MPYEMRAPPIGVWATRFRRLVRDYERCAQTLADMHLSAFVYLMLTNSARLAAGP